MASSISPSRMLLIGVFFAGILLSAQRSMADARADYLIEMLESSSNYRLRVQAATTLGKLRVKASVPALVRATRDKNDLVIISAAIALKQIGDSSVVPSLESAAGATKSDAARSQLALTIRILKEIRGDGSTTEPSDAVPKFLVRVDAMGNSSKNTGAGLAETMRQIVVERVREERDIIYEDKRRTETDVRKMLKERSVRGFIVSGAILRLEQSGDQLFVKLGLNLFTNPDYNLMMMPTSEAALRLDPDEVKTGAKPETLQRGIRIVVDSLVNSIFRTLRQSE